MYKFNEKYMLKQFINRNKYVETYKAIKSTSNVYNEDKVFDAHEKLVEWCQNNSTYCIMR